MEGSWAIEISCIVHGTAAALIKCHLLAGKVLEQESSTEKNY